MKLIGILVYHEIRHFGLGGLPLVVNSRSSIVSDGTILSREAKSAERCFASVRNCTQARSLSFNFRPHPRPRKLAPGVKLQDR
jgi:hypothetical protein